MATLATYMHDTSARRRSRLTRNASGKTDRSYDNAGAQQLDAVGELEDRFRLRPLPNDSIYFYSKKIDNQRLIRQADPDARGQCWSAVGAAAILLVLGGSIIAPHVGSVLAGYKLEALKQEQHSLIDQKRDLEVKEAGLLGPERLNDLAKLRRLGNPAADQVIHLDVPSVDGSFARNQAPTPASAQ